RITFAATRPRSSRLSPGGIASTRSAGLLQHASLSARCDWTTREPRGGRRGRGPFGAAAGVAQPHAPLRLRGGVGADRTDVLSLRTLGHRPLPKKLLVPPEEI